jgi:hypothetical protein
MTHRTDFSCSVFCISSLYMGCQLLSRSDIIFMYFLPNNHIEFPIFAFKTPNFNLSRDAIPPSPQAVHTIHAEQLMLQHFHDPSPAINLLSPHNQDARLPADLEDWPPMLITNFVYGCIMVKHWGKKDSFDILGRLTKGTYYDP